MLLNILENLSLLWVVIWISWKWSVITVIGMIAFDLYSLHRERVLELESIECDKLYDQLMLEDDQPQMLEGNGRLQLPE